MVSSVFSFPSFLALPSCYALKVNENEWVIVISFVILNDVTPQAFTGGAWECSWKGVYPDL